MCRGQYLQEGKHVKLVYQIPIQKEEYHNQRVLLHNPLLKNKEHGKHYFKSNAYRKEIFQTKFFQLIIIIIINDNFYSALSKSSKALYNQDKKV